MMPQKKLTALLDDIGENFADLIADSRWWCGWRPPK
jgi:hypothetical protein